MGARRVALFGLLAACACGPKQAGRSEAPMADRIVADFERAVLASREAYQALFDFTAVGQYEILLHRYDALGRFPLDDETKARFLAEDGTPYPAERERRNIGNFYPILAQRTVGTGGCHAVAPVSEYARNLVDLPALPDGTPPGYETLRQAIAPLVADGGVVGIRCDGGQGGLAVVWTRRQDGYRLITMYDDVPDEVVESDPP